MHIRSTRVFAPFALLSAFTGTAHAQEGPREPRRFRVTLGPQVTPSYPGADDVRFGPLFNFDFARGDAPFAFEALDESAGFSIINSGGLGIGPALTIQRSRRNSDVGVPIGKVSTTFEAGGFIQYSLSPSFRVRAEVRQGVGGHDGLVGIASADLIARDGDNYVLSIGPRATFANARYHRAYFGVNSAQAAATGLPTYEADAGLQSVGLSAGALYQLSPRWGLAGYARYDRLVADPADSPVVRRFGSRDQLSGGVALSYTFGR